MSDLDGDVARKLACNPAIARLHTPALDVFLFRDFASEAECRHLIGIIEANRKPSRLFASHPDPQFRTSDTCNLDPMNAVVRGVDERISALLGIGEERGEFLQGQKYAEGQQYKAHHDYLREDQTYWARQEKVGGQRTWTAMIYLNSTPQGGETYFRTAELMMRPRRGNLVAWDNRRADGSPNPATLHQGMPVISGEKYIVTKWFRENPWGPPGQQRQETAAGR